MKSRVILVAVAIGLTAFTHKVIHTAWEHGNKPPREQPEPWSGPKIPKCDKELWLRIKDGC